MSRWEGRVRALVRRSDGAWIGSVRYDPYGSPLDSAGTLLGLRYRWTGREHDAETGFYFHRSRYYDPAVGRFVQEDPVGAAGGTNPYAYVGGDVLRARDPAGLMADYSPYSWRGLCIGDYCWGAVGDPGPGGSGASQRLRSLMTWAGFASYVYDLYQIYKAAFSRRQAEVLSTTNASEVIAAYTGAKPLEWGDFNRLYNAVTGLTYAGPPLTLPGGITATGSIVIASFEKRLERGLIFANPEYIAQGDKAGEPLPLAATPFGGEYGYTAIHPDRFFAPAERYYLRYNAVHEELHYLAPPPGGGSPTYHCEIHAATRALTGRQKPC